MFPRQFHTFTSKFISFLCSKSIHLFTLFHFMSHKYFKFNMFQTNSSPLSSYHFQGSSTLLINIMIIHIFAPDRHLESSFDYSLSLNSQQPTCHQHSLTPGPKSLSQLFTSFHPHYHQNCHHHFTSGLSKILPSDLITFNFSTLVFPKVSPTSQRTDKMIHWCMRGK